MQYNVIILYNILTSYYMKIMFLKIHELTDGVKKNFRQ